MSYDLSWLEDEKEDIKIDIKEPIKDPISNQEYKTTVKEKSPKMPSKDAKKKEKTSERLDDSSLTPSAKLNLLKYLYAQLTGKTTTNKIKKSMKTSVLNEISKF